jgi:hypothetical protein
MLRASLKLQLISCLWPPGRISPLFSPGPAAEKGYNVVFSPTDRKNIHWCTRIATAKNTVILKCIFLNDGCTVQRHCPEQGSQEQQISNFCAISGFLDTFIFSFSNISVFNLQNLWEKCFSFFVQKF